MNTCIRNLLSVLGVLIVFNCYSQGQISIENHEMSTSEIKSMAGFLAADKKEIIKLIRQQTKKQSQKKKETALSK